MRNSCGFTLIEVAILLVIVGLVSVGGLTIVSDIFDSRRSQTTGERLNLIEQALQSYVEEFSCLPCPANGALASTGADNNFGRSFADGAVVGGNCAGAASVCQIVDAVVPWRTLGLSEDEATDGWGNRIRYYLTGTPCNAAVVLHNTAGMDRCTGGTPYPTGTVTVNDNDGALNATAAYVLVSSGPDKSLALSSLSGVTTNDIYGQSGGGGGQDENSDDDAVFAYGDFNGASGVNHFDDIVRFKSAAVMVQLCGPGTCQNPE